MFELIIKFTLIYTTILALVALGGMFSERSGIINLGLEGIMVIGALTGIIVTGLLQKSDVPAFVVIIISIISSIAGGIIFSLLLAVACINYKADQTIAGTSLNILSVALAVIVARMYTKTTSSEIKFDNSIFIFGTNITLNYFTFLMAIILGSSYVFLYKTKFGLHLMACGEHPQAASSVGINVYKQRYLGVIISGALAGLGGLAYVVPCVSYWDFKNGVNGFGFLALAVMIFGQWKPFRILMAALIFGFFQTISFVYPGKFGIPSFVYKMLPYIISMIVLAFTSKRSRAPKAEGIPYEKGQR